MSDSPESIVSPDPVHRSELSLGFTEPKPEASAVASPEAERPAVIPDDDPVTQAETCPAISERGPPAELMARPQWVAYKLVANPKKPHKPSKIPFRGVHEPADTTDPKTWLTYNEAVALAKKGFAGVGYVFAPDDPYAGIDLDPVRDAAGAVVTPVRDVAGVIQPWAWDIIKRVGSYTELSPSGAGLHILLRADLGGAHLKQEDLEIYDRARYFTVTGQVLDGYETIREAQSVVTALLTARKAAKPSASTEGRALPAPRNADLSDEEVLKLIAGSKDAKALHRLYIAGDTRPNRSGSENDFELACLLARYLGGDPQRIERLMRDAAIADRAKWDRADYLPRTIRAALMKVAPARAGNANEAALAEPLRRVSIATLAKNPTLLAPPAMLAPRLVWAGRGTMFAGREKDGKTTYAAWAVVQAIKNGYSVLWLSTDEDQATIVSRFVHLVEQGLGITDAAERDTILSRIDVLDRDPASWEEAEALHAEGWRPDIYVVDTLSSFLMAVDGKVPETSEGEVWQAKVKRFKAWITNSTAGVLLLVHANRADGTYRGSTGIGAALDANITLYGGLSDAFCRRLERKGRFGIGCEKVVLRYKGDEHPGFEEVEATTVGAGSKKLFTDSELNAVRVLCEAAGPLRSVEWEQEAKAQFNTSSAVVDRARRVAEKAGYISRTSDKKWQVTPVGWQFAVNQGQWQSSRYPYEDEGAVA